MMYIIRVTRVRAIYYYSLLSAGTQLGETFPAMPRLAITIIVYH